MRRWKSVVRETDLGFDDLALKVLAVEWHGYYSASFATLPVTLPSQWYGFDLVDKAVGRGAVIVVTKGLRDWDVAVPSLHGYSRAFRTHSHQAAHISPRNLGSDGFRAVTEALKGHGCRPRGRDHW
jgi:hypothetical protein